MFVIIEVKTSEARHYWKEGGFYDGHTDALAVIRICDRATGQIKTTTAKARSARVAVCQATAEAIGFDLSRLSPLPDDSTVRERVWIGDMVFCADGPSPLALAQAVLKAAVANNIEGAAEGESQVMSVEAVESEPPAAPVPAPPVEEGIEVPGEGGPTVIRCSTHE